MLRVDTRIVYNAETANSVASRNALTPDSSCRTQTVEHGTKNVLCWTNIIVTSNGSGRIVGKPEVIQQAAARIAKSDKA
jgi:hypothetical protein